MDIRFGLHLDGLDPEPASSTVGHLSVGPKGLMRLLEVELGIPSPQQHRAEQLVIMRGACEDLIASASPQPFFADSFRVDALAVSSTLLSWRETWRLHGWEPSTLDEVPPRVRDMVRLEKRLAGRTPKLVSDGERLASIRRALEDHRTKLRHVTCVDRRAALPLHWQRLLEQLGCSFPAEGAQQPGAPAATDLGIVQRRLLHADVPGDLAGDGTFTLLAASSRDVSASYVAELLRKQRDGAVVLAEKDGVIVDNAFERAGLPRVGFQHYSRFRAISQVLKLALGLLWEPLDAQLLLQFLLHPEAPISRASRGRLAEAVAREPGVGGRAWQEQCALIAEEQGDDERAMTMSEIAEWFESPRFGREVGVPVDQAVRRVQRVKAWLSAKAAATADADLTQLYANASAQCRALLTVLTQLGTQDVERIRQLDLERLTDEVTADQPDPKLFAEVGHLAATTHASLLQPGYDTVVWWDPVAAPGYVADPWSAEERASLAAMGASLPTPNDIIAERARSWLQPLLAATRRFVMIVHDEDDQAPLLTRVQSLFPDLVPMRIEESLLQARGIALDVPVTPLATKPLPSPQRWWHLQGTPLREREVESYSSLSQLFFAPHAWTLNYLAQLRPGRAEDLNDGPRLYGQLAHRLFENFFNAHPTDWRAVEVDGWLRANLPPLLASEGAVLLSSGRGVDRQRFVTDVSAALKRLVQHLDSAGAGRVDAERALEAQLTRNVGFRGTLDLLFSTPDGTEVILDSKYGGEKYRSDELANGAHLQLAAYGHLLKFSRSQLFWPEVAYFIVSTGNVLATSSRVFADALVRSPQQEEGLDTLWQAALNTYRWRRAQLASGYVEVNSVDTEADHRFGEAENGFVTDVPPSQYDDFVNLLGWHEFA